MLRLCLPQGGVAIKRHPITSHITLSHPISPYHIPISPYHIPAHVITSHQSMKWLSSLSSHHIAFYFASHKISSHHNTSHAKLFSSPLSSHHITSHRPLWRSLSLGRLMCLVKAVSAHLHMHASTTAVSRAWSCASMWLMPSRSAASKCIDCMSMIERVSSVFATSL